MQKALDALERTQVTTTASSRTGRRRVALTALNQAGEAVT
jgi:hypothetical protein